MRMLWSCVLATGLFLIGLEVYEGRRAAEQTGTGTVATEVGTVNALEDGTGCPPPPPPPPTK